MQENHGVWSVEVVVVHADAMVLEGRLEDHSALELKLVHIHHSDMAVM